MKMNKMVFPLVLALAATLATTGCKKGFTKSRRCRVQQRMRKWVINRAGTRSRPAGQMPGNNRPTRATTLRRGRTADGQLDTWTG